ncbi:glycosyltransferase [Nodosilinea nodulosa]|uniref:glycosyltransferase n=1 Tax=Nodosilinea nodulosa TaxID=416001 RepID=UPI0002F313CB|nr:glycosyltransferase [Nodosilinea nodulosa]
MKALQINFSDYSGGGGGAIAMYRLCQGLAQLSVDCKIISKAKILSSDQSALMPRFRLLEGGIKAITKPLGFNDIHAIGTFWLRQHPFFQAADILNLHVIHSDYFNYLALPALTTTRPAVFTLHDMWAFTGHCAYSYDCSRWQSGCGSCPYPESYPSIQRDRTRLEWRLKRWVYGRTNLAIAAPSRWLVDQAQKSILNGHDILHIPNGLDVQTYAPIDKTLARQALGLPLDQLIVMSCAESLRDRRKGMDLLVNSLNQLPASLRANTMLLLMGNGSEAVEAVVQVPTVSLGFVTSDRMKALAYSAADVFLFPTRADNLPIVLQESMACGTPMVSFDVGGVPDLVRPGITGLLAPAEQADEFVAQVVSMLSNEGMRQQFAVNCREIAVKDYAIEHQAKRYKALYETMVNRNKQTL